jgi:hypothetical protein
MTAVHAQEEGVQPDAAAAEPAPASDQPQGVPGKIFMPLVRVVQIRGTCEVNNPDVGGYAAAVENKVYPLGTRFRTTGPDSSAILVFSAQESVQLAGAVELAVIASEKNPDGRVVRLVTGKIKTNLRENLPEGSFGVEMPNVVCKNMEGRGEYALTVEANTEALLIKTITGVACVEGPQYKIPALRAANIVDIQTSSDHAFTRLTSVSGDFAIIIEKGEEEPVNYGMSPKAVVKIWRENAPVGGRPVISALVVSPTGIAKHHFAYAVDRPGVATGELVDPAAEEKAGEEMPVLFSADPKQEQKADGSGATGADGDK